VQPLANRKGKIAILKEVGLYGYRYCQTQCAMFMITEKATYNLKNKSSNSD